MTSRVWCGPLHPIGFLVGMRGVAVGLFLRPFGPYETNRPLGNGFCPRFGNKGASARRASCSRRLDGL